MTETNHDALCRCRTCRRRPYERERSRRLRAEAREQRMAERDKRDGVLRIYPESEYDEMDRRSLPWLEAGYQSGKFQSLPEREGARSAA